MKEPLIVFLDASTVEATLRPPSFAHLWRAYPQTTPQETVERLQGAKIAVTNKVLLLRQQIERLPELEMIAVAATGTNNVDLDCCRERGIAVCNIRNYAEESVPEHVFALILALKRNLLAYSRDTREWVKSERFCLFSHPIHDIASRTLGVVGMGSIGRKVAAIGRAFGMEVVAAERRGAARCRAGYVPFHEAIERSDILTLHCPLAPETLNLIGKEELAIMRPDSILINTARGGLVDEEALVATLAAERIGGAGFDVLKEEPPRADSPLLAIDSPNFILTPHVAWASSEAQQKLADQLIDNIDAWLDGRPQNRVA